MMNSPEEFEDTSDEEQDNEEEERSDIENYAEHGHNKKRRTGENRPRTLGDYLLQYEVSCDCQRTSVSASHFQTCSTREIDRSVRKILYQPGSNFFVPDIRTNYPGGGFTDAWYELKEAYDEEVWRKNISGEDICSILKILQFRDGPSIVKYCDLLVEKAPDDVDVFVDGAISYDVRQTEGPIRFYMELDIGSKRAQLSTTEMIEINSKVIKAIWSLIPEATNQLFGFSNVEPPSSAMYKDPNAFVVTLCQKPKLEPNADESELQQEKDADGNLLWKNGLHIHFFNLIATRSLAKVLANKIIAILLMEQADLPDDQQKPWGKWIDLQAYNTGLRMDGCRKVIRGTKKSDSPYPVQYRRIQCSHRSQCLGCWHEPRRCILLPRLLGWGSRQVNSWYSYVQQNSVNYGMLWFDVEGPGTYWSGNCNSNAQFLATLISTAQGLGVNVGIYTSNSQWSPIMCGSSQFSNIPLWYPHYDNNPSFSDWSSFGGWSSPNIKQYNGDGSSCGIGFDYNWYP
jgi:hypothetical protein